MYVYGYCANHFTVRVNDLKRFPSLNAVNELLESHGFRLNHSGGTIKGSAAARLEQSSTLADTQSVAFVDGVHEIPSCYYEFARRYPLPDGREFSGFVADQADRIFESTDFRAP
jgi:hypothetical protein